MEDFVKSSLSQEDQDPFHQQMLGDCRNLISLSRRKMASFYPAWDNNDRVYRGIQGLDPADKKAAERKEPVKMIVPLSYSQVQTFVSFCYSLYTQREHLFELLGVSEDDHRAAKIGEAFLARDLAYNVFQARLYQFLLDIGRFSVGVLKTSWVRETQLTRVTKQKPGFNFLGMQIGGGTYEVEEITTKYLGNRIMNVSPYRFFPDTRLPICRFQEGEFCASEDEYSWVTLKQMEADGQVTGIDFIRPMSKKMLEDRGTSRLSDDFDASSVFDPSGNSAQSKGTVVVTEVQRILIPKQYLINGVPLGEQDYPTKYVIWYANDNRVIKCEPLGYLHNQFTYDVAEYNPDMHNTVNMSLSDTIDMLQSTLSWFINSRITSVRKVISNLLVVDPDGVEMKDLDARNPIIRLKPSAANRGVDRFVKQLNVTDVTTNHIADAKYLQELVQLTTGINDNLLGQFHTGRRSATEARNVTSSAAARIKMLAEIIYRTAIEPMGKKMISNLRDGLDEETVVRLVGIEPALKDFDGFVKADKSQLVGSYDFEIFDGTLPSEKGLRAQTLQELLIALMSNPEAAIILGLDPKAILMEQLELQGIRNPERFTLQAPPQQAGAPGNVTPLAQPSAQPYEQTTELPPAGGPPGPTQGFSSLTS